MLGICSLPEDHGSFFTQYEGQLSAAWGAGTGQHVKALPDEWCGQPMELHTSHAQASHGAWVAYTSWIWWLTSGSREIIQHWLVDDSFPDIILRCFRVFTKALSNTLGLSQLNSDAQGKVVFSLWYRSGWHLAFSTGDRPGKGVTKRYWGLAATTYTE